MSAKSAVSPPRRSIHAAPAGGGPAAGGPAEGMWHEDGRARRVNAPAGGCVRVRAFKRLRARSVCAAPRARAARWPAECPRACGTAIGRLCARRFLHVFQTRAHEDRQTRPPPQGARASARERARGAGQGRGHGQATAAADRPCAGPAACRRHARQRRSRGAPGASCSDRRARTRIAPRLGVRS
jgi:hypothetical protein